MRVLLIKTSSLGDIVHLFPALNEMVEHGNISRLDWVVERSFAEVPKWHPKVDDVIPVDLRAWRKRPFSPQTWRAWRKFVLRLRRHDYDLVIDAQGLLKSAWITRKARGPKAGLDWSSAWEPLATLVYGRKVAVDPSLHAVHRMQHLLASFFDYQPNCQHPPFGLDIAHIASSVSIPEKPYVVFAHATSWESKKWPVSYWRELITYASQSGCDVLLPWGNSAEQKTAQEIALDLENATVLPALSLSDLAVLMSQALGVVAVDTGLGHIANAIPVPLVSLYGPTDPAQTGTLGDRSIVMQAQFDCAPCNQSQCRFQGSSDVVPACFSRISPEQVWHNLLSITQNQESSDDATFNHHHNLQPS